MGRHGAGSDRRRPRNFPPLAALFSALRRLLGVPLAQVADAIGVAPSSITRLEVGAVRDPESAARLLKALADVIAHRDRASLTKDAERYTRLSAGSAASTLRRMLAAGRGRQSPAAGS